MSKPRTILTRMLVLTLAAVTVFTCGIFGTGIEAKALVESIGGSDSLVRTSLSEIKSVLTSISYSEYLAEYADTKLATETVSLDIFDLVEDKTTATVVEEEGSKYGTDGNVLVVGDDGKISLSLHIDEDAVYNIEIEYWTGNAELQDENGNYIFKGKSTDIERMLLIDNEVPFKEARSISLTRSWCDSYPVVDEDSKAIYNADGTKTYYTSTDEQFKTAVSDQSENVRIFQQDNGGNEMKPVKTLNPMWTSTRLHDSSGYSTEALRFTFLKGDHVLTLTTVREPIVIKSIKLVPVEDYKSYDEYLDYYKAQGVKDYTGDAIKIQAEYPSLTSDKTIYQLNDRTSAISEPQDAALQRLNTIGGDKWTYVGQWIEYTINAPEDGFYNIVLRYNQSYVEGMYVSRKIYINGEVPFAEALNCRFDYDDDWVTSGFYDSVTKLPEGEDCFKFYLAKGENTIRIEVVLGDMAEILSAVESTLTKANAYYRKILMLTGPDPDEYRDYGFDKIMPDVLRGLKAAAEELYDVSDRLTEITGVRGNNNGTLERVAFILDRMGRYPDKIAVSLSTMKDYLAALGSWLTDSQSQPLTLDYIQIQSITDELPQADAGFWQSFANEFEKFFVSFFADYNSISSTSNMTEEEIASLEQASIEVWTTSSRDEAQITKRLVDDDFMQKYNIPVTVKLVVSGTLLPATLAGTGPDIAMNIDQSTPINYAIRSAVLSLNSEAHGYDFNDFSQFREYDCYKEIFAEDDARRAKGETPLVATFDETFARFADTASVPITLYGETYAVPCTMSFSMMFYRKDIFVEMGIDVPNTWDDFKTCISTLQASNLNIGFPQGTSGSLILMYQQGDTLYDEGNYEEYLSNYPELFGYDETTGKYTENVYEKTYKDEEGNTYTKTTPMTDGMTINLDSNISLASFKTVCSYFTMYDFPVSYSAADRFRDGSMPLLVADYASMYNTLIVFAPEISGLWEFTPLPGTLQDDGKTIDNTTVASISNMIMMRSVEDTNAFTAWLFMQWWTSSDIQSSYANEMEALLGPSAKQATANLEALALMSWSKDELDNLMAQFNAVCCTPEYPGSYIISRYTNFAFLDVYNDGEDPVTELLSYIVNINGELSRKRQEFGLLVKEDFTEYDEQHKDNQ